ncbi:MAG: hypothetical protein AAGF12_16385 [Myxococcota bacterium]
MDEELRSFRIDARRRLVYSVLIAFGVLGLFIVLVKAQPRMISVLNGETDIFGAPTFAPRHTVSDEALREIDWLRVHGQLIPRWTVALGRRDGSHAPAFEALQAALRRDPNAAELLQEVDALLADDPLQHHRRIDYLLWAYNDYLDSRDLPFRVEATLRVSETRGAVLSTRSYRVLSDLTNRDGQRVRILARLDPTNVVEGFLGHVGRPEDGVLVFFDRVLRFSTHELWPLMEEDLEPRLSEHQRAFAPLLRATVRDALPQEQYALLKETAEDQLTLLEVTDSIHARHECGSEFRVWGLPYNGLSPQDQLALVGALEASDEEDDCPEITRIEAAQMIGASERLSTARGIEEALEGLALLVAQAVISHELSHAADREAAQRCQDCGGMSLGARGEYAAFVASLEAPTSSIALFQLCGLRSGTGPHGVAARRIADADPDVCRAPNPSLLQPLATRLSARHFGGSLAQPLPEEFPSEVELLPRMSEARYAEALRHAMESDWEEDLTIDTEPRGAEPPSGRR